MKFYRIKPISLFSSLGENQNPKLYAEEIYFNAGYIVKSNEPANKWVNLNNIASKVKNDGKYFYFFPEDAIKMGCYTHHFDFIFKLMEYDFPEDIAFKLIGNGYYIENDGKKLIPETLIEYQDMGDKVINSSTFTNKEKMAILKESIKEPYNRLHRNLDWYKEQDFETVYKDLCKTDRSLFGAHLINQYCKKQDFDLISNPQATTNSWTINSYYNKTGTIDETYARNIDYLKEYHLPLFLDEEAIHDRELINNEIMNNDVPLVKKLINDYHQKYHN
ncbi:MAG: hypothetical protein J5892_04930 [Bacilli bacterium]|nr:hypothetical protein [Bacilli bacterium]